jgi:diguanylate cyclase (GGDEF)-like protein/PAS domain S-box-containing protein
MKAEAAMQILVVDDDATARLLMRAALVKAGYEVRLATGGEDALRAFREAPADMVMLDVEMPDLNGHEVCLRLRAEAGELLPIVMVTGMDDVRSVELAYEAGATDFIAKPLNWALIGHRVRYLRRAHLAQLALLETQAALVSSQSRLDQAQALARLGGWQWSAASARIDWSGQALRLLGMAPETLPDRAAFLALVHAEDAVAVRQAWEDALAGRPYRLEFRLSIDGHISWVLEQAQIETDAQGRVRAIVGTLQDITERKETETRIARMAYFDSLTGLPNRQSFIERLSREVRRAQRDQRQLAVMFMDLDGFKTVNDSMGHIAGDLILQQAADRLRQALRPSDMVSRDACNATEVELARLGGDEFTALVVDIARPEDVMAVADRIHAEMRVPFLIDRREVLLTASIGIALFPGDGDSAMTLLEHADTAMYHAKEAGRDNWKFYRTSMTERAQERLDLSTSLRLALERQEFTLVYQPQFDVCAGRVLSVEALIRWTHPVQGQIPPLDFIPLAEEYGLIVPIGEWVLRTACADAARWQRAGQPLTVAVNVSPLQFKDPNLVQTVRDTLAQSGLAPERLVLELTESALMEDAGATLATLHELRACGVQFALDDFGTGYSSLSYLRRMPLANVKVDRSFVSGLPADGSNQAIVQAILSMAESLGFSVTAEGVETSEQARTLTDMNCNTLQGYFIAHPVPAAEIPAIVARIVAEQRPQAALFVGSMAGALMAPAANRVRC